MINRLIKLTISILFYICYKYGCMILHVFKRKHSDTLVILRYHSVTSEQRSRFVQQMDELVRVSKPVFADLRGRLSNGTHYSSVTFDDGFQNVIENAFPELRKRKIPTTLFIPTDYLGKIPGWINNEDHSGFNERIITADQLSNLPTDLVMIGSHCLTHQNLTALSQQEIKKELVESKSKLEKMLNKKIELLAFPYGAYDKKVLKLSKQAGYKRCFSDVPSFPAHMTDKFMIGRIGMSPEDFSIEFRLKFLGAYQWLNIAVGIKRKLRYLLQLILNIIKLKCF